MMNTLTLKVKDNNTRKLLRQLETLKLIEIISETNIDWTPKKFQQAKGLLKSLNDIKKHEKGKLKLKSAKAFLNEL